MIKKYHPNWAIFGLVIIGIVVLAACVTGGIWLAHGLSVAFEKWGACPSYFADFLGGALGLTVGFVLDKFCIEKIDHVFEYRRLMMTMNHELNNNKKTLDELEIMIPSRPLSSEENNIVQSSKQFEELDDNIKPLFMEIKKLKQEIGLDSINYATYINGNAVYYWSTNSIKIRIVDDVVKNAETVATIINTPFVSQHVRDEIIDRLGEIYDKIKRFNEYWDKLIQNSRNDATILEMLKLRDEINILIDEHFKQCNVK